MPYRDAAPLAKWCVMWRDEVGQRQWCVLKDQRAHAYRDSMETACDHFVVLPWGIEKRLPTCAECAHVLGLEVSLDDQPPLGG